MAYTSPSSARLVLLLVLAAAVTAWVIGWLLPPLELEQRDPVLEPAPDPEPANDLEPEPAAAP